MTHLDKHFSASVVGGRKDPASTDTLWEIANLMDLARCQGKPLYISSLDQRMCFDKLWRETLHELVRKAKLPEIFNDVLNLYGRTARYIFLDGGPTPFVLQGDGCGTFGRSGRTQG